MTQNLRLLLLFGWGKGRVMSRKHESQNLRTVSPSSSWVLPLGLSVVGSFFPLSTRSCTPHPCDPRSKYHAYVTRKSVYAARLRVVVAHKTNEAPSAKPAGGETSRAQRGVTTTHKPMQTGTTHHHAHDLSPCFLVAASCKAWGVGVCEGMAGPLQ